VFKRIAPFTDENRVIASGDVEEKPGSAPGSYRKWATEVVREEIHKAGWRLADILEKSLAEGANGKLPGNTTPVPAGH
jgi:hypothetical protein